jgi:hypothetical protein
VLDVIQHPASNIQHPAMSTRANVQSSAAIEAVRGSLVAFIDQVSEALIELGIEMRRVLEWLEHDRPRYWKTQVRLAHDQVHEAQQALHRCLMFPVAGERPSCYEERANLKRAEARLAYCVEKQERVRSWQRTVQHELFEYEGRISQLVRAVETDVPQAIGVLDKLLRHLEAYQSLRAGDPKRAYNDLAVAEELWPQKAEPPPTDGEAASAAVNRQDATDPRSNVDFAFTAETEPNGK